MKEVFWIPILTYGGAALALFSPLLWRLQTGLHDRSDTVLNTWILAWQDYILTRSPLDLFNAPIFHPLSDTLAYSEILWPIAPLALPIQVAFQNPILSYNLFFLASFLFAGFSMYLLALYMTGSRAAAWTAGFIYAFSPHQFGHLSQLQLLTIGWLPLVILFLDRFWQQGLKRDGALLALMIVFQTLSSFYYGFQVALVVAGYILYRLVSSRRGQTVRRLLQLILWGGASALFIAPFALPYVRVRANLGLERSLEEALAAAPGLMEYLLPGAGHHLYGIFMPPQEGGGLFLGVTALLLAGLGVARWRPISYGRIGRAYWLLIGISAMLLSLGPSFKWRPSDPGGFWLPFAWLYQHVPGMTVIRAPGRFGVTVFLALALLASMGLTFLLHHLRKGWPRPAMAAVAVVLILMEYVGGADAFIVQPMPSLDPSPEVYAWLARQQPPSALVELPLIPEMALPPSGAGGFGAGQACPDYNIYRYQYFQMIHWLPMIDGYGGFTPPHHRELGLTMAHFPSQRSLAMLRGLGVKWVVVHSGVMESFSPGRAQTLRRSLFQSSGVVHVRDFGADWIFRVDAGSVTKPEGRVWVAPSGQAFLILASSMPGATAVIPPDQRLHMRGIWRSSNGEEESFQASVALPLLVEESSVVPLRLPTPSTSGRYTLELFAENMSGISRFVAPVDISPEFGRVRLHPVQALTQTATLHLAPGDDISLSLDWLLTDRPQGDIDIIASLVNYDGAVLDQKIQSLGAGRDMVRNWTPRLTLTSTFLFDLPEDALGKYGVSVRLFNPHGDVKHYFFDAHWQPVASLFFPVVVKQPDFTVMSLPPKAFLARFGDIYLLRAEPQSPLVAGKPLDITFDWVAARPIADDYTQFVHLMDEAGQILAQRDAQPLSGRYPTSVWSPGEVVEDHFQVTIPEDAAGRRLCLRVGFYNPASMRRLARTDATTDFWADSKACWWVHTPG